MAHILVYVQRVPQGVHPASQVSLCLARDTASTRGATVTAVCPGDAGPFDRVVADLSGRRGADVLTFLGPHGLPALCERLRPVHVLVPWTAEGLAAGRTLPQGPVTPRWLDDPQPHWDQPDAVTGIIAGVLPWYDLPTTLEADYEGDVDQLAVPEFSKTVPAPTSATRPALKYWAGSETEDALRAHLQGLGATPVPFEYASAHETGTLLWFDGPGEGLPAGLAERAAGARVILLPGPVASFDPSWALADWVVPGAWLEATQQLHSELWRLALA